MMWANMRPLFRPVMINHLFVVYFLSIVFLVFLYLYVLVSIMANFCSNDRMILRMNCGKELDKVVIPFFFVVAMCVCVCFFFFCFCYYIYVQTAQKAPFHSDCTYVVYICVCEECFCVCLFNVYLMFVSMQWDRDLFSRANGSGGFQFVRVVYLSIGGVFRCICVK